MGDLYKRELLRTIYREYARDSAFNHLREHHRPKRVVPGHGSLNPKVIFVGEAPGRAEATTGKPFMGAAGAILDDVLNHVGLKREMVFITNIVKYRPTVGTLSVRNRTPSTAEIVASIPYLRREIDVFGPAIPVIALGSSALKALPDHLFRTITEASGHGWYDADRSYGAVFHPAVAVYDPNSIHVIFRDIAALRDLWEIGNM